MDSMLAEAHTFYGYSVLSARWDIVTGRRELQRGAELDPNSADATPLLSNAECYATNDVADGLANGEHAVQLDPTDAFTRWSLSICQFMMGRYDDAIATQRAIRSLDSTFFYNSDFGAESHLMRGEFAQAVAMLEAQRHLWPRPMYALAYAYAMIGRRAEARRIATDLEQLSRRQYVDPDEIGLAYAGTGDADDAMKWFARLEAEKAPLALGVPRLPEVKPLANDPRFKAFVVRIEALNRAR